MQYSGDLQGEEEEEVGEEVRDVTLLLALVICRHRSRQSIALEVW